MERSLSATSDASSFYQSCAQIEDPLCHCSRQTTLAKSWTDDNPGRRFFKYEIHGFFVWADKEKPHGWQKVSLIEAREQIRRQKEEIKELKDSMRIMNQGNDSTLVNSDLWKKHNVEKNKLQTELLASREREKMLRQFVLVSWDGFMAVSSLIVKMLKN